MAFISVVIPIYKVEDYLRQCVDSVLSQSFSDLEVILVNDGSPDSCPMICDEYAKNDSRVIVIHKKNGGLSDARNAGMKVASGEYITFLDADDYWVEDALTKLLLSVDNSVDCILVRYTKYYELDKKFVDSEYTNLARNMVYGKPRDKVWEYFKNRKYMPFTAGDRLIKREILIGNDLFFEVGITNEDLDWSCRVLGNVSSYDFYSGSLYIYRKQRVGSITDSYSMNKLRDQVYLFNKWSHCFNAKNELSELITTVFAKQYLILLLNATGANSDIFEESIATLQRYSYLLLKSKTFLHTVIYVLIKIIGYKNVGYLMRIYLKIRQ